MWFIPIPKKARSLVQDTFRSVCMGFFDKIKKVFTSAKTPKKAETVDQEKVLQSPTSKADEEISEINNEINKYENKTLEELVDMLQDYSLCDSGSKSAIVIAYVDKLFWLSEEQGGFGLTKNGEYFFNAQLELAHSYYEKGIYGGKNQYGQEVILNYDFVFVKNFLKKNHRTGDDLYIDKFLKLVNDRIEANLILKEILLDENCLLYDPWIMENDDPEMSEDDKRELAVYKFKVILFVFCESGNLEKYNMFKRVHGIPTDEYLTFEDFKPLKTLKQLRCFLDNNSTMPDD